MLLLHDFAEKVILICLIIRLSIPVACPAFKLLACMMFKPTQDANFHDQDLVTR